MSLKKEMQGLKANLHSILSILKEQELDAMKHLTPEEKQKHKRFLKRAETFVTNGDVVGLENLKKQFTK